MLIRPRQRARSSWVVTRKTMATTTPRTGSDLPTGWHRSWSRFAVDDGGRDEKTFEILCAGHTWSESGGTPASPDASTLGSNVTPQSPSHHRQRAEAPGACRDHPSIAGTSSSEPLGQRIAERTAPSSSRITMQEPSIRGSSSLAIAFAHHPGWRTHREGDTLRACSRPDTAPCYRRSPPCTSGPC